MLYYHYDQYVLFCELDLNTCFYFKDIVNAINKLISLISCNKGTTMLKVLAIYYYCIQGNVIILL